MTATSTQPLRTDDTLVTRKARLARRLAAVAGAAGAAAAGDAAADSITYTPTAGVVQSQNIPGFSFTPPTTVTSGTLRPPATPMTFLPWDVDGDGNSDFLAYNGGPNAVLYAVNTVFPNNPNQLLGPSPYGLLNLANGAAVGPLQAWTGATPVNVMTYQGVKKQGNFVTNTPGYFGFRFAFNDTPTNYYYGWGSLTIDELALGQGFRVTEAFYQTTPNTAIEVGDVPLDGPAPVPELSGDPSGIALLAAGFFGLEALRARRRRSAIAC